MKNPIDFSSSPWITYVAPFAAFLVLTPVEGFAVTREETPHPTWYPLAYSVKVALVAAVAWACRSTWRDLTPSPGWTRLAVSAGLGVIVTVFWVGLDPYYPRFSFLGARTAFDPGLIPSPIGRIGFLAVRFVGLAALVPLIEELFWRSFLMRWLIDPAFTRVPIGRVTPFAVAVTSVLFGLEHPEWLPGLLTGLLWAALLAWSRSLTTCLVSHAVANLGLGLYVLATGEWKFL